MITEGKKYLEFHSTIFTILDFLIINNEFYFMIWLPPLEISIDAIITKTQFRLWSFR